MFRDHTCSICCENLNEKFQKKKIAPHMNFTEFVQWNSQEKSTCIDFKWKFHLYLKLSA